MDAPVGQVVTVTLETGEECLAEWDGSAWWVHQDDSPEAEPPQAVVVAWRLN